MPALTTAVSEGEVLTFEKGPVSFRAAGPPRNSLGRYLHGNELTFDFTLTHLLPYISLHHLTSQYLDTKILARSAANTAMYWW